MYVVGALTSRSWLKSRIILVKKSESNFILNCSSLCKHLIWIILWWSDVINLCHIFCKDRLQKFYSHVKTHFYYKVDSVSNFLENIFPGKRKLKKHFPVLPRILGNCQFGIINNSIRQIFKTDHIIPYTKVSNFITISKYATLLTIILFLHQSTKFYRNL